MFSFEMYIPGQNVWVWRILSSPQDETKYKDENIQPYWTTNGVINYLLYDKMNQGKNSFSTIYSATFNYRLTAR